MRYRVGAGHSNAREYYNKYIGNQWDGEQFATCIAEPAI